MQTTHLCALLLAATLGCGPDIEYLAPQGNDVVSDADAPTGAVSFARDIRPLMDRADGPTTFGCKRCHYPSQPDPQGFRLGGLDLSSLGTLRRGGVSSGSTIVIPGNPSGSAIVQKLEGTYPRGARMPKDRAPWSAAEIALVRRWIQEGAKGADSE